MFWHSVFDNLKIPYITGILNLKLKPTTMPNSPSSEEEQAIIEPEKIENGVRIVDLETYEEMLEEAIASNSSAIFPNADKHHAAVAMSLLFKNTKDNVSLLVESFNGEVSNNDKYLSGLDTCFERGVNFKILFLNEPNRQSKGYKKLIDYNSTFEGKVQQKKASDDSVMEIKSLMESGENLNFGEIYNFGLFDKNKYRLEIIPSKYVAVISVNDSAFVTKCQTIFDNAFLKGVAVE